MLDLVSNGRVDFGTGESSSEAELGGFLIDPREKRAMWEEGLRVALRCLTETPFTGHAGRVRHHAAAQRRPEAAAEAAPAGVGGVQPPRHHPPRGAEGDRRAGVRVHRPRGGAPLDRRLLRRRSPTECVPIGDAVNPNVACVTTFMCHDDEQEAMRARARGRELLRVLARALLRVRSSPPGRTDVWAEYQRAARRAGLRRRKRSKPRRATAIASARRSCRTAGSSGCAARSARPTRSATTCAATRTAASTR